jgi:NADP-reducing hydrogenase subunit HndB
MADKIESPLKNDASPQGSDGHPREKNVGSGRSSAGFGLQRPIKSPADLLALAGKAKEDLELRSGPKEVKVTVHMGTCGIAAGARDVVVAFLSEIDEAGLGNVTVHQSGCAGLCEMEPMATVQFGDGSVYHYGLLETRDKVHRIVQSHLVEGKPVAEYLVKSA